MSPKCCLTYRNTFFEPSCLLERKKMDHITFLSSGYKYAFSFKGQTPVSMLVSGQYVSLFKVERAGRLPEMSRPV